jgi:hypothetical protein
MGFTSPEVLRRWAAAAKAAATQVGDAYSERASLCEQLASVYEAQGPTSPEADVLRRRLHDVTRQIAALEHGPDLTALADE